MRKGIVAVGAIDAVGTGYWVLGAGYWVLGAGLFKSKVFKGGLIGG